MIKIYEKQASSLSFEELYRNAYTLVINKHGKLLYKEITDSIKCNILPYADLLKRQDNCDFLQKFNEIWENHVVSLGMVSDISMYLDKNFVTKEKMVCIKDSGILLFKKHVFRETNLHWKYQELVF